MVPAPDREFTRHLLLWYSAHHRRLPWRRTSDPYRIWVSEVMLQQTTVAAVIPYYERWLVLFPDVRSLARAPLEKVLRAWQGLGYYARARNLHRSARLIVRNFGGRLPDDEAALRGLPGFGAYTAAAVLSLAFGRPCPLVDANVRRVLMRVFGLPGTSDSGSDKRLLERLKRFFPTHEPGRFNQAIMELGALVCRSRNPQCLLCPVRPYCRAAALGRQERIPRPKSRVAEKIEAVIGVIADGERYLIQKRPAEGLLAGLWEFPGGKVEPGEASLDALRREIREEVGVEVVRPRFLADVRHSYTRFDVTLHVYLCGIKGKPSVPGDRRWVTLQGIRRYPLPSGSVRIVDVLEKRTGGPTSARARGDAGRRSRPAHRRP